MSKHVAWIDSLQPYIYVEIITFMFYASLNDFFFK